MPTRQEPEQAPETPAAPNEEQTLGAGEPTERQPGSELRAKVETEILRRPEVTPRNMMGTTAYLVRGRMFAFWVADGLVAKLPDRTRQELLDRRQGVLFQGPQGRGFGEWTRVPLETDDQLETCLGAVKTAYDYVGGSPPKRRPARKRRR